MDSLVVLQDGIEKVFRDYANFLRSDEQVQIELIFDRDQHRYLLVEIGWQNGYHIYGTLLHIDIVGNKLWIQQDGTEAGIAEELVKAGISKAQIVLGYKLPESRKLTKFALS